MPLRLALNHMVCPRESLRNVLVLAQPLGVGDVEIRNDLRGPITDGTPPETVKAEAVAARLSLRSVNASQRFSHGSSARAEEATGLIRYAQGCDAAAIVLRPVNGLPECSLRSKWETVEAIDAVGAADVFRLVHDTFHHNVAGEHTLFADRTSLVTCQVSSIRRRHVGPYGIRTACWSMPGIASTRSARSGRCRRAATRDRYRSNPLATALPCWKAAKAAIEGSLSSMPTEHNKKAA